MSAERIFRVFKKEVDCYLIARNTVCSRIAALVWIRQQCIPAHEHRISKDNAGGQEAFVDGVQQGDDGGNDTNDESEHREEHTQRTTSVVNKQVNQAQHSCKETTERDDKIEDIRGTIFAIPVSLLGHENVVGIVTEVNQK